MWLLLCRWAHHGAALRREEKRWQGVREAEQKMPGLFWGQGMNQLSSREPCCRGCFAQPVFLVETLEVGRISTLPQVAFLLRKPGTMLTYLAWSKLKALYFVWLQLLRKIEVMEAEGHFLCFPLSFLSQAD